MDKKMLKDERIISFIENVEKMIYTEQESTLIKDELLDHIDCLITDYMEAGYDYDDAVSKTLLSMGDPKEIGYSFTDYDLMKKRKFTMIGLKLSSLFALVALLIIAIWGKPVTFDSDDSLGSLLPVMINLGNAILFGTSAGLLSGYSTKLIDMDTTPQLILWSSRKRIPWEYLLLSVFILPIVITFMLIYFYEVGFTSSSIFAMWPILPITYSVWAFLYSEKFRIPKFIVVKEGFIIKGRFLSWTAISSYNWRNDYMTKKGEDYNLVLTSNIDSRANISIKRSLPVHKRQKKYLEKILKERIT